MSMLWYVDRATGLVLLALLTVVVALGVLATGGRAGRGVPRFVTQRVHRHLALLAVLVLVVHVLTAVLDEYVDLRWWQAVLPFVGDYQPLWVGLGAVALDLLVLVAITSLVRERLSLGLWRAVHLLAYLAWPVALAHGLGLGTDLDTAPGAALVAGCVGLVGAAITWRVGRLVADRRAAGTAPMAAAPGSGRSSRVARARRVRA